MIELGLFLLLALLTLFIAAGLMAGLFSTSTESTPANVLCIKLFLSFFLAIGIMVLLSTSEVGADRYNELKEIQTYSGNSKIKELLKDYSKDRKISNFESQSISIHQFFENRKAESKYMDEELSSNRSAFFEEVKK